VKLLLRLSYVATTAAIVWGIAPLFVDIHPDYLTIDETKIEQQLRIKKQRLF
jgi:dTDP-4-amino-4,6-dideoxygalactose transaminase